MILPVFVAIRAVARTAVGIMRLALRRSWSRGRGGRRRGTAWCGLSRALVLLFNMLFALLKMFRCGRLAWRDELALLHLRGGTLLWRWTLGRGRRNNLTLLLAEIILRLAAPRRIVPRRRNHLLLLATVKGR